MPFDPENKINKLCAEGMQAEGEGKPDEAKRLFEAAWAAAATDLEKSVVAHYLARHQPSVADKLNWDMTALKCAKKADTDESKAMLPSLYLNVAKCHEDLAEPGTAYEYYVLAQRFTSFLSDDGYGTMIKAGVAKGVERTAGH